MKWRLKHLQRVPYGGMFRINRPDLGMVGVGTVFDMLEQNVRAYRRANGLPTGLGFSQELEEQVAILYPDEAEYADPDLSTNIRLTFDDVVHGTEVLVAFKAAGSPLVPKEEALKRSEICSRCKFLVPFARPCGGLCGALKSAVDAVISSSYEIPLDNDLRACGVCHCFAASHVRIPYRFLERGLTEDMKRKFQKAHQNFSCWKIEGAM